jgi:type II secretory pathway predicted ATPase ExeA
VQPVPPEELGTPLYEAFYGLTEQPFALSTDPRFLYMSGSHRRAYEELLTGLRRREGLLLLTGETGTGKTTLCRAVLGALGPRTFSAIVLNPYMSASEVLRVILRDFGLVTRDEIRRGAFARADTPQLLDTLESFLQSLIPLNSYAVLVIDEAQSLSAEVLDRIRMLGSFEQDGQRLLQIVLGGQPGLLDTLQTESLRALNERITRRTALLPLRTEEIEGYIAHRLTVAGRPDAVRFDAEALWLVANLSRGLPRRVNLLCDRALEAGRTEQTTTIGPALVKRAAQAVAGAAPDEPATTEEPAGAPEADRRADAEAGPDRTPDERTPLDSLIKRLADAPPPVDVPVVTPPRRRFGVFTAVALAVGVVALLGAGYYAWTTVNEDPGIPAAPSGPGLQIGTPAQALPPPSDEDVTAWLAREIDSGQLPDNRDQLH